MARSRSKQSGYILALNITVLAMMLVGATYIGQRMALAMRLAQAEKQRVANEQSFEDVRARVLFLLATLPRTPEGLGNGNETIRLDGRYYRAGNGILVSLQDARGLFGVNVWGVGAGRENIERLLATYELEPVAIDRLTDALLDYRDNDNLRRINGAEKDDYRTAGKSTPVRNDNLLVPTEVARILGWAGITQLWEADPISEHLHTQPRGAFNPNTAGWRALAAMSGITPEMARNLVSSRQRGELDDISRQAMGAGVGNPFSANAVTSLFPGETVIVTLRSENETSGWRMAVSHENMGKHSPWRIAYAYRAYLEKPGANETFADLPDGGGSRNSDTKVKIELPF